MARERKRRGRKGDEQEGEEEPAASSRPPAQGSRHASSSTRRPVALHPQASHAGRRRTERAEARPEERATPRRAGPSRPARGEPGGGRRPALRAAASSACRTAGDGRDEIRQSLRARGRSPPPRGGTTRGAAPRRTVGAPPRDSGDRVDATARDPAGGPRRAGSGRAGTSRLTSSLTRPWSDAGARGDGGGFRVAAWGRGGSAERRAARHEAADELPRSMALATSARASLDRKADRAPDRGRGAGARGPTPSASPKAASIRARLRGGAHGLPVAERQDLELVEVGAAPDVSGERREGGAPAGDEDAGHEGSGAPSRRRSVSGQRGGEGGERLRPGARVTQDEPPVVRRADPGQVVRSREHGRRPRPPGIGPGDPRRGCPARRKRRRERSTSAARTGWPSWKVAVSSRRQRPLTPRSGREPGPRETGHERAVCVHAHEGLGDETGEEPAAVARWRPRLQGTGKLEHAHAEAPTVTRSERPARMGRAEDDEGENDARGHQALTSQAQDQDDRLAGVRFDGGGEQGLAATTAPARARTDPRHGKPSANAQLRGRALENEDRLGGPGRCCGRGGDDSGAERGEGRARPQTPVAEAFACGHRKQPAGRIDGQALDGCGVRRRGPRASSPGGWCRAR